jgi:hypothetical protein
MWVIKTDEYDENKQICLPPPQRINRSPSPPGVFKHICTGNILPPSYTGNK